MKSVTKRILSILFAVVMLLSVAAMIAPGAYAAEIVGADGIDSIPSEHLVSVRDYSDFATMEEEGTTYVDDSEAHGGKAVCYSRALLNDKVFVSVKRYDHEQERGIGDLHLADLKVNAGYQTYMFTYKVPADTTEGGVFFIMNNWQLNSKAFCKDFAPYAGKTVQVYLSMKITGPSNGSYSVFVDRVALATVCSDNLGEDGICALCGTEQTNEEGQAMEPIVVHADQFSRPYSAAFGVDKVVEDPDSQHGKAVVLSYEERKSANDQGLTNAMIRTEGLTVGLYTYDGAESATVGLITIEELQANSGSGTYVTYTFPRVMLIPTDADTFLYMFDCWGLQVRFTQNQLDAMRGKYMDVSVSLKVTGDVTSSANPPAYYIDEIIVKEAAPHEHVFGMWAMDDKAHSRICEECNELESGDHQWDAGVVTKEATETADGEKTYTCSVCEGKKYEKIQKTGGENTSNNNSSSAAKPQPAGNNLGLIIAIGMLVLAAGVAVVAVILLKPKKK